MQISQLFNRQQIVKNIIILAVVIFYVGYSYFTYLNYQNTTNARLQKTAKAIEDIISDTFTQYSLLMRYTGSQIAEHNAPSDLQFIDKILHSANHKEYNVKNILSWPLLHWIADNDKILVDYSGILKESKTQSVAREYTLLAREKPWCLHVSSPDLGSISQTWVIPVELGITDKNGKYLGLLSTGFSIAALNNILYEKLNKEATSFIILDSKNNIVVKSSDNTINERSGFYKNALTNFSESSKTEDYLREPIKQDSVEYSYYKKFDNYPYVILAGQDSDIIRKKIFNTVFSVLSELSCVTVILLTILYLYHKRYTATARAANKAKHEIIQRTVQQFNYDIDSIYQLSDILLKCFKNELKIQIVLQKQIEMVCRVREAARSLQKFSIFNFDRKWVNVKSIIDEVVTVHSHETFIRNIKIKEEIEATSLNFNINELNLKQILIGLISHRLKFISSGGYLKIKAFINTENYNDYLYIVITDDGLLLPTDNINTLSKSHIEKEDSDVNLFNFDIDMVFSLIKLHNGSYTIDNSNFKEKMITVKFSSFSINSLLNQNENNLNNIHILPLIPHDEKHQYH